MLIQHLFYGKVFRILPSQYFYSKIENGYNKPYICRKRQAMITISDEIVNQSGLDEQRFINLK